SFHVQPLRLMVAIEIEAAAAKQLQKCEGDDRFSGRTTHVSPTALNLAQNAQRSEPIGARGDRGDRSRTSDCGIGGGRPRRIRYLGPRSTGLLGGSWPLLDLEVQTTTNPITINILVQSGATGSLPATRASSSSGIAA